MRRQFPLRPAGAARRPGPARDTARSSCAHAHPGRRRRLRPSAIVRCRRVRKAPHRQWRGCLVPGTRGCGAHAATTRSTTPGATGNAPAHRRPRPARRRPPARCAAPARRRRAA
ncbi:hypothetical protein G6F46_014157 [Rhizopus delemar]|nr:hypothetical protein G6F46_014157 [Rhizopus delemar]